MAKQEQHLTTARLSAFIDEQLSPAEQAQTEAHLHTCAACQQQLTELRQTVALLHALPQPRLPRSFTLPIAESSTAPRVSDAARPLAPITPLPRRNAWPAYVTGAVRAASTLAAVIGIVFLLSGLFGMVISVGGGTPSSGGSASTVGTPGGNTPHVVTQPQGTKSQEVTPTPTKGPSVTSPNKNEQKPVQQNPLQAFLIFFTIGMAGTRAIIGTILLALGIIGFAVLAGRM